MVSLFTPYSEETFYSEAIMNKESGRLFSDTGSLINDSHTISSYSSSIQTDLNYHQQNNSHNMSNIAGLDATTTPPPTISSVTATTSPGWSVVKSHTTTSSDLTIPPPPSLFSHSHPDTLHYSTATVLYPKTSAESSYYNIGDYDMMHTSTPPEIWAHPSPLKELEIPEFRMLNDTHKKLDSPYLPFYPMQQQHQHQLPLPPPPPPPVLPQASRERYHPRFKSANARLSCHPENYHQPVQFLSPPLVPNSLYSPPSSSKRPKHTKQAASIATDRRMNSLLPFQFHAALHASTAVMKKEGESPVTYLNRGQTYLIELDAVNMDYPATMTSTFAITFHEESHRKVAKNYWKFWISQQEVPSEARAIELDQNQTEGAYNIRFPSFDKVTFDWHAHFGAKLYIRFNCLSTDFSRIKGVKGIPMRASMETQAVYMDLPLGSSGYVGSFQKRVSPTNGHYEHVYFERCYCQIKLFRDKGAERKNKDDGKQMSKQYQKVVASTNGSPQHHPLWPVLSQPVKAISYFTEIDSDPELEATDMENMISTTPIPSTLVPSSNKRKHKHTSETATTTPSGIKQDNAPPSMKKRRPNSIHFFVWTHKNASFPQSVELEHLTTDELKAKLSTLLQLHPTRIADILWRRKKQLKENDLSSNEKKETGSPSKKDSRKQNDLLVLVEDSFINEHIYEGLIIVVEWEIKSDGNVNLILNF